MREVGITRTGRVASWVVVQAAVEEPGTATMNLSLPVGITFVLRFSCPPPMLDM